MDSDTSVWFTIVNKVIGIDTPSRKTGIGLIYGLYKTVNIENLSYDLLKTVDFWTVIICFIFACIMLFVGVKYKKLSLFPFVSALIYEFTCPLFLYFFKNLNSNILNELKKNEPQFYEDFIRGTSPFYFLVSAGMACSLLLQYNLFIYMAALVVASDLRKFLLFALEFPDAPLIASVILIAVLTFVAFFLLQKFENIVLAVFFAFNGSLFFLTIMNIIFGKPAEFIDFALFYFEWRDLTNYTYLINLAICLTLSIAGYFSQMYFKGNIDQ